MAAKLDVNLPSYELSFADPKTALGFLTPEQIAQRGKELFFSIEKNQDREIRLERTFINMAAPHPKLTQTVVNFWKDLPHHADYARLEDELHKEFVLCIEKKQKLVKDCSYSPAQKVKVFKGVLESWVYSSIRDTAKKSKTTDAVQKYFCLMQAALYKYRIKEGVSLFAQALAHQQEVAIKQGLEHPPSEVLGKRLANGKKVVVTEATLKEKYGDPKETLSQIEPQDQGYPFFLALRESRERLLSHTCETPKDYAILYRQEQRALLELMEK